jgi:hypothetical protein
MEINKDYKNAIAETAHYYSDSLNISVLPVQKNKTPNLAGWGKYMKELPGTDVINNSFYKNNSAGLGIICGKISGNIECLDEDSKYDVTGSMHEKFMQMLTDNAPELLNKLIIEKSINGGYHYIYKCKELCGNVKLASRSVTEEEKIRNPHEKEKVLYETRGEGGYFVTAPTVGYEIIQGSFDNISEITADERNLLHDCARFFNEKKEEVKYNYTNYNSDISVNNKRHDSPFKDFNENGGDNAINLLKENGWTISGKQNSKIYLKRPGDSTSAHSGNYDENYKRFRFFSTSTLFDTDKSYTCSDLFMKITGKKTTDTCNDLVNMGYGKRKEENIKNIIHEAPLQNNLFFIKNINEWIEQAKTQVVPNMLFDKLWFENELCILFSENGCGKSALAVQIADSISKRIAIPGFKLTAEKQAVLLYDFELSIKTFENRYSNNYTNHYIFDNTFCRAEINPEGCDYKLYGFKNFEDFITDQIEKKIIETNIKILVIDNITYLNSQTESAKDALPLMKRLITLKKKYNLSMLVLAHTPKRDLTQPLTRNHLMGSKHLSNLTDSIFCIGESQKQSDIRYIKQIKSRNSELIYHTENVIICQLTKSDNFLQFEFLDFDREILHLQQNEKNTKKEDLILQAQILSSAGKNQREIASELGISLGSVNKYLKTAVQK